MAFIWMMPFTKSVDEFLQRQNKGAKVNGITISVFMTWCEQGVQLRYFKVQELI